MKATKFEITSSLLKEAMTPQEHEAAQKQREKDWAQRGKAAGALAGFATGAGAVLHKGWTPGVAGLPEKVVGGATLPAIPGKPGSYKAPGAMGLGKAALVGAGSAIAAGYIGKKIAQLVARMTREGYSKPEVDAAVSNLKRKARG